VWTKRSGSDYISGTLGERQILCRAGLNDTSPQLPRAAVFGWSAFAGTRAEGAPVPCLLDLPNVAFTTAGRGAIALALHLAGIGPGDRVLVPTYHCPTMVAPVVRAGAVPEFYPLHPDATVDLDHIERRGHDRCRVLLAPHFFGYPQPMSRLRQFCDRFDIILIEDCAHAMFGTSDGRPIGSWGDFAIGSLAKFFPVAEGGVLASARRAIDASTLRWRGPGSELRDLYRILEAGAAYGGMPGLNPLLRALFRLRGGPAAGAAPAAEAPVEPGSVPLAAMLAEYDESAPQARPAHASIWLARHATRDRIVARRGEHFRAFARAMQGVPGARIALDPATAGPAPYVVPVRVDAAEPAYRALRKAGVPVFRWDRIWPGTPRLEDDIAPDWSEHLLQFPCHQDLGGQRLRRYIDTVTRFLAGRDAGTGTGSPEMA